MTDFQNQQTQQVPPTYPYQNFSQPQIPEEYTPISMWGYFGYQLLFAIPCIGFIVALVLAFTARNINLRNFARSYFCMFIITIVLVVLLMVFGGVAAVGFANTSF